MITGGVAARRLGNDLGVSLRSGAARGGKGRREGLKGPGRVGSAFDQWEDGGRRWWWCVFKPGLFFLYLPDTLYGWCYGASMVSVREERCNFRPLVLSLTADRTIVYVSTYVTVGLLAS